MSSQGFLCTLVKDHDGIHEARLPFRDDGMGSEEDALRALCGEAATFLARAGVGGDLQRRLRDADLGHETVSTSTLNGDAKSEPTSARDGASAEMPQRVQNPSSDFSTLRAPEVTDEDVERAAVVFDWHGEKGENSPEWLLEGLRELLEDFISRRSPTGRDDTNARPAEAVPGAASPVVSRQGATGPAYSSASGRR